MEADTSLDLSSRQQHCSGVAHMNSPHQQQERMENPSLQRSSQHEPPFRRPSDAPAFSTASLPGNTPTRLSQPLDSQQEFLSHPAPPESEFSYQLHSNDNHVSLDFTSITPLAAKNASTVNVNLWDESTKYVWVEYNRDSQLFEVRVSYNTAKPVEALLNYTVNLSNFVQEYMWVGSSSSSGGSISNFYVGSWTFESFGIPAPDSVTGISSDGKKSGLVVGLAVGIPAFIIACISAIVLFVRRSHGGRPSGWNRFSRTDTPVLLEGVSHKLGPTGARS